jgi:acid phosphatase (class A)
MAITRRLLVCVLSAFLLSSPLLAQTPPAASNITFVQLTDAHLFDDDAANNSAALDWAIARVNRLIASGTAVDFVVYTGDLGLSRLPAPPRNCPASGTRPAADAWQLAVDTVAARINKLAVRRIYFLPGNNDLVREQVGDIERYRCFLAGVQEQLQKLANAQAHGPAPVEVTNLGPDVAVGIHDIRLLGLNSASLKNKEEYQPWCAGTPEASADPAIHAACPQIQVEELSNSLKGANPALLFTHIPYLKDPYPPRAKELPGAWDIPGSVRTAWEQAACDQKVVAIFAGHFHDGRRELYGTGGRTPLQVAECVSNKIWVAPPLAVKHQENQTVQARGLLVATVASNAVTRCDIHWYSATDSADKVVTTDCRQDSAHAGAPGTRDAMGKGTRQATGYIAMGAPDFMRILPPFPSVDSPADAVDVAAFQQWHEHASLTRRQLAQADVDLSYSRFSEAFGGEIDPIKTPLLIHLLDRVEADMSEALNKAKAYYNRPRPYQRFPLDHVCGFDPAPKPDATSKGGNSYPSGHSTFGWSVAVTLAEVSPGRAQTILARGREYGESRVVCGVHYPSDVAAAQLLVSSIIGQVRSLPEYRQDLSCAQEEHAMAAQALPEISSECIALRDRLKAKTAAREP